MGGLGRKIPFLLLGAGLILRLALPVLLPGDPFRGDGADYLRHAWNLKEHGVFSGEFGENPQPTFRRMPGVPFLLYLGLATTTPDSRYVIWPNLLLACLGLFLVFSVFRKWEVPERLKWFLFGAWALFPVPEFYAAQAYPTVPALTFVAALIWAGFHFQREQKNTYLYLMGISIGLGMYFRPELALFALPVAWYFLRQSAWKRLFGFAGVILVVLVPWTLRNASVSGEFLPFGGNLLTDPPSAQVGEGSCGRGVYDWLGTWHFKESHTKMGAWYFMQTPVEELPEYAFGTETERKMIAAIKQSGTYSCADDARLQEIARARAEAHPLRHRLVLPLRRCFFLLFRTERTDRFRPEGWPEWIGEFAWWGLALFTGAVHLLGLLALFRWRRLPLWLQWLGAAVLIRLCFFAWFYHVEFRYMLVCFPIFLLLAALGGSGLPWLKKMFENK